MASQFSTTSSSASEIPPPQYKPLAEAPSDTPSVEWAANHPDQFLTLLFVSPQVCPAVDKLLSR